MRRHAARGPNGHGRRVCPRARPHRGAGDDVFGCAWRGGSLRFLGFSGAVDLVLLVSNVFEEGMG
jgi:hypothetical protein